MGIYYGEKKITLGNKSRLNFLWTYREPNDGVSFGFSRFESFLGKVKTPAIRRKSVNTAGKFSRCALNYSGSTAKVEYITRGSGM